jgi:hypothetical protein
MFDPHIYAYQPFVTNSTSHNDAQTRNSQQQTPTSSPQKSKHVNTNTVIPVQSETPVRKQSQQEDETVASSSNDTEHAVNHLNTGSGSNSGENSRKTSTISDCTSSDYTPENTVLTPRQDNGEFHALNSATPNIPADQLNVKASPVRKLSRFLVSPTIVETANKELIVQEDASPSSLQHQHLQQVGDSQHHHQAVQSEQPIEMNINEESYQRVEQQAPALESELQPQQSTGFKMPETLEQLKIELENITHAHVSTKSKEAVLAQQSNIPVAENQDDNNAADVVSEAQVENSIEYTYTDPVGSMTTGDNTSVYNSRRTSADMNTNPTDMSFASGPTDYDENLVSEATDDIKQFVPNQQVQIPLQQHQLQNEGY